MNGQKSFYEGKTRHKCTNCGEYNLLIDEAAQKNCVNCGKLIDSNKTICEECKNARKKRLLGVILAAGTIAAAFVGIANSDNTNESNQGIDFTALSNDELEKLIITTGNLHHEQYEKYKKDKRLYSEKIQDPGFVEYERNYETYDRASTEKRRRYDEAHPEEFPKHREHGWYLPNDND